MVRRSALAAHPLLSEGRGWGIVLEMVLRMVRAGHSYVGVHTKLTPRRFGHSKVQNATTILANLKQVLGLRALLRRPGKA